MIKNLGNIKIFVKIFKYIAKMSQIVIKASIRYYYRDLIKDEHNKKWFLQNVIYDARHLLALVVQAPFFSWARVMVASFTSSMTTTSEEVT